MSDTRAALIAEAARLLEEGGPEAVTLREVGARAGVSHNAPYKHFQHKEALLAAVAADGLERWTLDDDTRVLKGAEPVRRILRRYVDDALARPRLFLLTYGVWQSASGELVAVGARAWNDLVSAVASAQSAGALPPGDPERRSALVLAVAHGAAHLALAGHLSPHGKGRASPGDLVDDLFDLLGDPHPGGWT